MSLQYNSIYHLHCEIRQASGRSIILEGLDQSRAYAGLLEGLPGKEMNDWIIESTLQKAAGRILDVKPHLLPPPRRDYRHEPGDMEKYKNDRTRRAIEWLPEVRCIASFKSDVTRPDFDGYMSLLTVVWFQDDFALPIQESVLEQLKTLDWNALATDVGYD